MQITYAVFLCGKKGGETVFQIRKENLAIITLLVTCLIFIESKV